MKILTDHKGGDQLLSTRGFYLWASIFFVVMLF